MKKNWTVLAFLPLTVALLITCSGISGNSATSVCPPPYHRATRAAAHWIVTICSSQADSVSIQAGKSKDDNKVYDSWKQSDGRKDFPVPDIYQGEDSIFVQLNRIDQDGQTRQTEGCVWYDGTPAKRVSYDGANENHQINKRDTDKDCACQ